MLGVFAAGRLLNAKRARSQLIGGMTFGVSAALFEEAVVDPRSGAFVNRDLAEYLVPGRRECGLQRHRVRVRDFPSRLTRCCPGCRSWKSESHNRSNDNARRRNGKAVLRQNHPG